jgi:hypothetical protein
MNVLLMERIIDLPPMARINEFPGIAKTNTTAGHSGNK